MADKMTIKKIEDLIADYPFLSVVNRRGITSILFGKQAFIGCKAFQLPKLSDITEHDVEKAIKHVMPTLENVKSQKNELQSYYSEAHEKLQTSVKQHDWSDVVELAAELESLSQCLEPVDQAINYLSK